MTDEALIAHQVALIEQNMNLRDHIQRLRAINAANPHELWGRLIFKNETFIEQNKAFIEYNAPAVRAAAKRLGLTHYPVGSA